MEKAKNIILFVLLLLSLSGCYHASVSQYDTDNASKDSFLNTHHYAPNYNFVVKADSMSLLKQQPEELLSYMPTDSFYVYKGNHLVVADVRVIKKDTTDSVWVQVARDQYTFGWIHEGKLLVSVVPDDPISQFISTFSDIHLLVFLVVISVIAACYLQYTVRSRKAKVVHFNDIDSFYPTLLAMSVASAATFYSSIQLFAPDTWKHFYFHPSLNPFSEPPILAIFLISVWAMIVMMIATIDDVYHKLAPAHATLYLCGLCAVCAANYIIFSITTMYYVGYALLAAYIVVATRMYYKNNFYRFVCGKCGAKLHSKGKCPKCGAMNL